MTQLDPNLLAQATALGNAFAFGFLQIVLREKISSGIKPAFFVLLSTLSTIALYFGLASDLLWVKLLIAGVSSAYAVTGGIDFYKRDVKALPAGDVAGPGPV